MERRVVIVGAGPAGLTAAYELGRRGIGVTVLEKEGAVGGISKTVFYKGYRFDIGGHRFFTKVSSVGDFWMEILGEEDFLLRNRKSRIFYDGKFFQYPLRIQEVLKVLGVVESLRVLVSYLGSRVRPVRPVRSFEDWVTNRFGARLYKMFFKTYTEKVWGMSCREISADWAAQRIKGLSMLSAIRNSFRSRGDGYGDRGVIRTLASSFRYPRLGPGMMWEAAAGKVAEMGGEISMGTKTRRICWGEGAVQGVEVEEDGARRLIEGTHFISSMPIRNLVRQLDPPPPREVREAAEQLKYRDFLTVAVMIRKREIFDDNWIYIHEPGVKVGRIQNFKNWSPEMVPDAETTCLGMEYFCFEGDDLWTAGDADLMALAVEELTELGLAAPGEIEDGKVVRMPKAYPVYDDEYQRCLETIRGFFEGIENLYLTGRNGMHKYNNQDHSMLSAMLAVENICGADHDLWSVNADEEYHEEVRRTDDAAASPRGGAKGGAAAALAGDLAVLASTQPRVPRPVEARESPD